MKWSITIDQAASLSGVHARYGPTVKNGCLASALALAVEEFRLWDVDEGSYQLTATPVVDQGSDS